MRVLFIAPWVPGPLRPRSLGLLRELVACCQVTAVCQTWSASESEDLFRLAGELAPTGVRFIEVRERRLGALARALVAMPSREPLQRAYVRSRSLLQEVDRVIAAERPEVIYYNVLRGTAADRAEWHVRRVVDLDEFRSQYFAQVATLARSPIWKVIGGIESSRHVAAEADLVARFDRILVSSPRDIREDSANVRLVRSPHSIQDGFPVDRETVESANPLLSMIGRFSYRANHDGAMWLVEQVMPLVWRDHPQAALQLVGAEPRPALRALASERIRVVGRVPEVAPFYRAAWVNVVPVSTATGVQMKLIEAAHLGVPSVVSPIVATGAGVRAGEGCLVADEPEQWATEIGRLLRDRELRRKVGAAGRAWSVAAHGQEAVAGQFAEALDGILPERDVPIL